MAVATMAVNTRNASTTYEASAACSNKMVEAQKRGLAISKMNEHDRGLALDQLLIAGDQVLYQLVLGKLAMFAMEAGRIKAEFAADAGERPPAVRGPANEAADPGLVCALCGSLYSLHFPKPNEPGGVRYCDDEFKTKFKSVESC